MTRVHAATVGQHIARLGNRSLAECRIHLHSLPPAPECGIYTKTTIMFRTSPFRNQLARQQTDKQTDTHTHSMTTHSQRRAWPPASAAIAIAAVIGRVSTGGGIVIHACTHMHRQTDRQNYKSHTMYMQRKERQTQRHKECVCAPNCGSKSSAATSRQRRSDGAMAATAAGSHSACRQRTNRASVGSTCGNSAANDVGREETKSEI